MLMACWQVTFRAPHTRPRTSKRRPYALVNLGGSRSNSVAVLGSATISSSGSIDMAATSQAAQLKVDVECAGREAGGGSRPCLQHLVLKIPVRALERKWSEGAR